MEDLSKKLLIFEKKIIYFKNRTHLPISKLCLRPRGWGAAVRPGVAKRQCPGSSPAYSTPLASAWYNRDLPTLWSNKVRFPGCGVSLESKKKIYQINIKK